MKLSQLLSAIGLECPWETDISSLTCDSRAVIPGTLFVALTGARDDGRHYIPQALRQGAAAVLCQPPIPEGAPALAVDNPRLSLALLAAQFYGHPAKSMTTIAITGTKGKTTAAHMLRDIFTAAGHKCGMIGTLGAFIGQKQIAQGVNTTPEPVALHALLRQMSQAGCSHVVMEVSSQAMKLQRVAGITFDVGLFLNLSPDHIGGAEHADFSEYRACKAALFRQCRLAVGNADDPNWPAMAAQLPQDCPAVTFGFGEGANVQGCSVTPDGGARPLSTRFTVAGATAPYLIPMPGAFNANDALACLALCQAMEVPDHAIRTGLSRLAVPGRTQIYPAPTDFTVLIDYAHNGESFRALLSALAGYEHRRIIVVFGACGDRPHIRRRDMARAAAQGADFAIITEDNPRSEPVGRICAQIASEIGHTIPWFILTNRRRAIFAALDMAQPGDIVALLGKGHETYIETNGTRRYFSEWDTLDEYFSQPVPREKSLFVHL